MSTASDPDRSPSPVQLRSAPVLHPTPARFPAPLTSLVGREREVAAVAALLSRPDVRLLTLIGPGGVGKTRLALAVAAEVAPGFADGAAVVPLAPVHDPELVIPTIARALGVREAGERPTAERLAAFLAGKHLLLVLDNLEQVVEAAPLVAGLLGACPSPTPLVARQMRRGEPGAYVDGSRRAAVSFSC